ncbi:lipase family protein [Geomonas sp. RF6]|uniref:lipase family protein n=1 Tax=Geomonas sp. RF6 TaxID=2897342 RepID=UPI001E2E9118|nr:lipase family protein [Geomonas sp. RF6]UFS69315.1 lipase family protein [Geomonas sp. RF6]
MSNATAETSTLASERHPGGLMNADPLPLAGDVVSASLIATVSREDTSLLYANVNLPLIPAFDVEIYKISYFTTDEQGALVNASGALVVPTDLGHPAPLVSYQHGTTTLSWDVASTAPAAGQQYRRIDALLFGSAGYVTALPDYLGYGDTAHRFHPYLHAATLASSVVDLLKGARSFCAAHNITLSGKLFLAGYSEGGYATMAATKAIQENHPDLSITASAPMAGPYDLSTSLQEILRTDSYPGAGYLAFAFWAYDKVYSLNLLDQVILPSFASQLDAIFDGSRRLVEDDVPVLPNEIPALFHRDFLAEFVGNGCERLKSRIRENDLHNWAPAVPLRLIHSRSDDIVHFHNSLTAYRNFSTGGGNVVDLLEPPSEGSHSECSLPSLLQAKAWFDTLI